MSTNVNRPVVLIVDDDLGFVCWLGEIFNEVGYQPIPALNSLQAVSLTKELNLEIGLVVMNPKLEGISEMIQNLSPEPPRIIIIRDQTSEPVGTSQGIAMVERPSPKEPISRKEWLKKVRKVLRGLRAATAC
jgi:DNA-binding response OmpR family regulator